MTDLIQHLRRVVLRRDGTGLSDGQLLDCFLIRHDEEAFAAKAAGLVAAGQATASVVSATVATLTEGVVKAMFLSKLRSTIVLLLAVTILTTGAGFPTYRIWAGTRLESDKLLSQDKEPEKNPPTDEDSPDVPKKKKQEIVRGSGKLVTRDMKIADFASVDVGNVFSVNIIQGDSFRTAITADDNLFDYIKVHKEGTELRVYLDAKDRSLQDVTLKATITMPSLSGLNVAGASQAVIKGFKGSKSFRTKVTGASELKGDIETTALRLELSGASRIELKGSAKTAILTATGASDFLLANLPLEQATVRLTGASHAAIEVKNKLDYTVEGASSLEYRGKPTLGKQKVSGVSAVTRN